MSQSTYLCQVKVSGLKDLLRAFYEENQIYKDDIKINPILYQKETKLSFEKCVSLSVLSGWKHEKSMTHEEGITLLWGSLSDAYDVKVEKGSTYLYTFRTKGAPPTSWFYAVSQKYMYLTFEVFVQDDDSLLPSGLLNPKKAENGNKYTLIFEKGEKRVGEEKSKSTEDSSKRFEKILTYLHEKEIDAKKYMKRIYEKHYQGAEKNVENMDYEGLLEDFVEKVKIHKYIQKVYQGDDLPLYEESRAFVEYVLSERK